jgi:hypothetical protein
VEVLVSSADDKPNSSSKRRRRQSDGDADQNSSDANGDDDDNDDGDKDEATERQGNTERTERTATRLVTEPFLHRSIYTDLFRGLFEFLYPRIRGGGQRKKKERGKTDVCSPNYDCADAISISNERQIKTRWNPRLVFPPHSPHTRYLSAHVFLSCATD